MKPSQSTGSWIYPLLQQGALQGPAVSGLVSLPVQNIMKKLIVHIRCLVFYLALWLVFLFPAKSSSTPLPMRFDTLGGIDRMDFLKSLNLFLRLPWTLTLVGYILK